MAKQINKLNWTEVYQDPCEVQQDPYEVQDTTTAKTSVKWQVLDEDWQESCQDIGNMTKYLWLWSMLSAQWSTTLDKCRTKYQKTRVKYNWTCTK